MVQGVICFLGFLCDFYCAGGSVFFCDFITEEQGNWCYTYITRKTKKPEAFPVRAQKNGKTMAKTLHSKSKIAYKKAGRRIIPSAPVKNYSMEEEQ